MITLVAFLLTILFLIGIHELGHFLAAKLFGVWVHEFAIGFGPAVIKRRRGETVYSLRLLPIGGYVRLAGEGPLESEVPPGRTLPGKPPPVRMAVALAGPLMNLAVAPLLIWLGFMLFGLPQPQVAGLVPDAPAAEYLQVGDVVLAVGGKPIWDWRGDYPELSARIQEIAPDPVPFTVLREGAVLTFAIPVKYLADEGRYIVGAYFGPRTFTNWVEALAPGSPLERAGLRPGDEVVEACGRGIRSGVELLAALEEGCRELVASRDGERVEIRVPDLRPGELLLGAEFGALPIYYRRPPAGVGISLTGEWLRGFFRSLGETARLIATRPREAGEAISGPVWIAGVLGLGLRAGGLWALLIIALISLNLGIFNLIPFPALDGSRILFALVELIARRPVPRKVEAAIHTAGFLILLALLFLITFRDIARLIG